MHIRGFVFPSTTLGNDEEIPSKEYQTMPIVTTSSHKQTGKSQTLPIVVIVAIVAVGATVFFILRGNSAPSEPQSKPERQKQIVEIPANSSPLAPVAKAAAEMADESPKDADILPKTNNYVKMAGRMMLPDGRILTFPPPPPGTTRTVNADGKIYECDSEGNWEDITPPPVFDNAFEEQLIGLAMPDAHFIPGLLLNFDEGEVSKLLEKPVVINDDDSEDVKVKKQAVAEMKEVMREYIASGGTYLQFVTEMGEYSEQERMLKRKGISHINRLIRAGKTDEAKLYLAEINEVLEANEFSAIQLPRRLAEALTAR